MEKVCRVLYKNVDLKDWIAFEVYLCKYSSVSYRYEAYWSGPLKDGTLFYESDKRLDALQEKMGACVARLGYRFFFQEHPN